MKLSPHWTSAVIGTLLCVAILYLVRRDRMQVRYALWWIAVASGAFVLGVFPKIVDKVGKALGVHYPPILAIIFALALLFIKSLTQDLDRCRREQNMRRLAQRLAILEARLEERQEVPNPSVESDPPGTAPFDEE
ncbi:MAG: DUF2304 domain-containing protein [Desulfosoma sp.]